jgi:hypothetical protein
MTKSLLERSKKSIEETMKRHEHDNNSVLHPRLRLKTHDRFAQQQLQFHHNPLLNQMKNLHGDYRKK